MCDPLAKNPLELPAGRTIEAERLHRKQRLAGAFRLFARMGLDFGLAGHITARDPELHDHFWVNPLGHKFNRMRVSDLELVDHTGKIVEGSRPINAAAFAIHSALHRARPDVVAAAHSHSPHGRAWSTLGRLLDPITQDSCAFFENHTLFDFDGIVFDVHEGERLGEALGGLPAIILKNHGLLTVGGSVEEAAWWFIQMEDACRVQLMAEAAGKPQFVNLDAARRTKAMYSQPTAGLFSFKTYYEDLLLDEPDLLD